MKFHLAPADDHSGLTYRIVSEGGKVQVGLYRVMYGMRVRAGFTSDRWGVTLDWCCGDNMAFVIRMYVALQAILSSRSEDYCCFDGLPTSSNIKPAFNDPEFMEQVNKILMECVAQ